MDTETSTCSRGGIDYTLHAEDTVLEDGRCVVSGQITATEAGAAIGLYDLSITKSVFGMLVILALDGLDVLRDRGFVQERIQVKHRKESRTQWSR